MFQRKDQASNDNIYLDDPLVVDGREGERVNFRANMNKKRNRRSILLPDEVEDEEEEEEIDSSHDVASKRRRKPGRGRRSMLLPSEEMDDFHCENEESSSGAASFQNLKETGAPSCLKSNTIIVEKDPLSSFSTTVTAATTHTNLAHDELSKDKKAISSTSNAPKPCVELGQEENMQGKPQIVVRKFAPLQKDRLSQMRIAVRKFCSIPLEERYKSQDAAILQIAEVVGYPIIPSIDILRYQHEKIRDASKRIFDASATSPLNLDWTSSPSNSQSTPDARARTRSDAAPTRVDGGVVEKFIVTNEMKRNMIVKMCPILERMESRRKEEVARVEECTGCQVERKRGKYKYVSLSTGKKVPSSKYEELYLDMVGKRRLELQQERIDRIEVAARHAAALQHAAAPQQKVSSESCTCNRPQGGKGISSEIKEPNEPAEECNSLIESTDNRLLAGEQTSYHEVRKTGSEEPQCVPEEETLIPEVCCSNNTAAITTITTTATTTIEGISKGMKNLDERYSRDVEENFPIDDDFPSRDNLSLDPEIAILQTTLFSTMDMALQTYSYEVLKIQEKRRGGQRILMEI